MVVLIVPLLTGGLSYNFLRQSVEEEIFRTNTAILEQAQIYIDKQMEQKDLLIAAVSLNPQINDFLSRRPPLTEDEHYQLYIISKLLTGLSTAYYLINDFYIYFQNSDIILSTSAVYTPERFYQYVWPEPKPHYDEWYRSLLSKPFRNNRLPNTGKYITYAQSLPLNLSGLTHANLIIMIDESKISVLLGSMDWLNNGYLYVLDPNGKIIFSKNYDSSHEEYLQDAFESDQGYRIIEDAPEGSLALSYVTSKQQGWKYISLMPTQIYMERVEYTKWVTLWLFVFSLLVGLLLVLALTYTSYSPISRIMKIITQNSGTSPERDEFRFIQHALQSTIEEKTRLLSQMDEQKPIIRGNILLLMLDGKFQSQSPISLETVGIHFPFNCFMAAVLEFDIDVPEGDLDISLIGIAVKEYLDKGGNKQFVFYMVEAGHKRLALLLNAAREYIDSGGLVDGQLAKLQRYIAEELEISCTLGLGAYKTKLSTLNLSYTEALRALNYRIYRGAVPIIRYNDIVKSDQSYYYPLETEQQITAFLKAGDLENSKKLFGYIFRENFEKRSLLPDMLSFLLSDIIGTLIKALNELKLNPGDVFGGHFDFTASFQECSGPEKIREKMYELLSVLCGHIEQHKKSHNTLLAENIHNYIKENYSQQNLCLQMIADNFHLSTAYLSRFFKEQSGEYLHTYINKYRIERARELLLTGDTGIGEIARLTGFSNDVTFNRVFKKLAGLAPGAYRQQNKR
jgi:AraC-like DNA-binding protein